MSEDPKLNHIGTYGNVIGVAVPAMKDDETLRNKFKTAYPDAKWNKDEARWDIPSNVGTVENITHWFSANGVQLQNYAVVSGGDSQSAGTGEDKVWQYGNTICVKKASLKDDTELKDKFKQQFNAKWNSSEKRWDIPVSEIATVESIQTFLGISSAAAGITLRLDKTSCDNLLKALAKSGSNGITLTLSA